MPAGCRMSSKARQSKPNRQSTSPRAKSAALTKPAASPKRRPVKLAALGPVGLNPVRFETGRAPVRSLEVPDRSGCGTYRRIRRRDQRPQRLRVRLQSAPCEADRGEVEGRRLCRDQVAPDRGQGQAPASSNASPPPTICPRISSCRSTTTPCPTNSSRTGSSRERKAISATASAVTPSSFPADNPDFRTSLSFAELIGKEMKAQGLRVCPAVFASDHGSVPASAAEQGNRRLPLR